MEPRVRKPEYPTDFWELGIKKTKEYLWTGDFVDADEALRLGMVNHVVPDDKLEKGTRWLAARIALNSLHALKVSKISVNQAADIMGQTAAVRASGNFWVMSITETRNNNDSVDRDRLAWSNANNARFSRQREHPLVI